MTGRATADPLSAVIVLTGATLASADLVSAAMWRFVRAWPLVNRYKHNCAATVDLAGACCYIEELPDATASRAAGRGDWHRPGQPCRVKPRGSLRAERPLGRLANRDPDLLPSRPPTAAVVRGYELLSAEFNATPDFESPGHQSYD